VSNTSASFRRRIGNAEDLQAVVRTMKAIAASSIEQYENSVHSLQDYYRTVELGLGVCLRAVESASPGADRIARPPRAAGVIVFGSDQGLVGQFNERVVERVLAEMRALPAEARVWAVGERVQTRLAEAGVGIAGRFEVPNSVRGITPLIGRIQLETGSLILDPGAVVLVVHNSPLGGPAYTAKSRRLLPLDSAWRRQLAGVPWPNRALPQLLGDVDGTLRALIREYLFISLYRACAESLASENASRLAAMERAERNIREMLEGLRLTFARERQRIIDEELFDVVSGFEALSATDTPSETPPRT
jgi:F-type H+-transporting ATPase subunit gamma